MAEIPVTRRDCPSIELLNTVSLFVENIITITLYSTVY